MANTLTGITAQTLLHRYFPAIYLVLAALLGCVAGWMAVLVLGFRFVAPLEKASTGAPLEPAAARIRPLGDYQIILDRNIFNPEGGGTATVLSDQEATSASASSAPSATSTVKQKTATVVPKNLVLIGTLTAGPNSLAVLRDGRETRVYSLGDEVAAGIKIAEISRNTVVLVSRDGSRQTLTLLSDLAKAGARHTPRRNDADSSNRSGIKEVGDNKYVIPRDVAEQARHNVNELMQQARMEPRIVGGQTDGFIVRMIRPHSFLAQLGLRLGDVVTAINGVQLNGPEKALQIFQQLREARNIKVDLLRHGQPLTLELETD